MGATPPPSVPSALGFALWWGGWGEWAFKTADSPGRCTCFGGRQTSLISQVLSSSLESLFWTKVPGHSSGTPSRVLS